MPCRFLLYTLLLISLFSLDGFTSEQQKKCDCTPAPARITLRHIGVKGIGYNRGYTTLEAFFSPYEPLNQRWFPFVDVRGHVFNNSRLAANAGVGIRYLSDSLVLGNRLWGINAYYDYRNTKRHSYYQASVGLESLGETWDFRVNGYLPFGAKKSYFYGLRFDYFIDHYMMQSRKREIAMKGANAEVGMHIDSISRLPLYLSVGPYYFKGGNTTWGGKLRAAFDYNDYIRLEGSVSYDHLFKWIGQGQLSLTLPLGRKREVQSQCSSSCCTAMRLSKRAVQNVDRLEIIPLDHKRNKGLAIDPSTGLPHYFIFVNNFGNSDGSYLSPFHDLASAQTASSSGDFFYVIGNEEPYPLESSFNMLPNQHLWGSGVDQSLPTTWGVTTVPAMTELYPTVIYPVASSNPFVTLANNNEVSGMEFDGDNSNTIGIFGDDITDTLIQKNRINFNYSIAKDEVYGIKITNNSGIGNYSVSNNSVSLISDSDVNYFYGMHFDSHSSSDNNMTWMIDHNSVIQEGSSVLNGAYGIFVSEIRSDNGSINNSLSFISNNIEAVNLGASVLCGGYHASQGNIDSSISFISNNSSSSGDMNFGCYLGTVTAGDRLVAKVSLISNNANSSGSMSQGIYLYGFSADEGDCTVEASAISNSARSSGNMGTGMNLGPFSCQATLRGNFLINSNTIRSGADMGNGILFNNFGGKNVIDSNISLISNVVTCSGILNGGIVVLGFSANQDGINRSSISIINNNINASGEMDYGIYGPAFLSQADTTDSSLICNSNHISAYTIPNSDTSGIFLWLRTTNNIINTKIIAEANNISMVQPVSTGAFGIHIKNEAASGIASLVLIDNRSTNENGSTNPIQVDRIGGFTYSDPVIYGNTPTPIFP
jgi:hypothetical protein